MQNDRLLHRDITSSVIGVFYEVYNTLGYGFLEHLYVRAMELELVAKGHRVKRQAAVTVFYKETAIGVQRVDMVIDDRIVVEIKSTQELHSASKRQIYNYLRATRLEVGLLLHFGPKPRFFREYCASLRSVPSNSSPVVSDSPGASDAL